ncbi:pyruvate kinase [Haliangium sp.]|uniref:pyruvate kinase n=1 Tax=Haliangium sp. TaxID=2663208 RepID=UPI003D0CAD9F
MRRAKIVCTLGPASSTPERIGELIDAGMNVARLNFSHGNHQSHGQLLQVIRTEAERRAKPVAVLLDLQGPKIRVGRFEHGSVELEKGQEFTITTDTSAVGDNRRVSTTYTGLPGDVRVGDQILLDDGYLSLAVTDIHDHEVKTVVVTGGTLKNNKGINLPHVEVSAPALSDKDRADLAFGLRMGVDYIALSFVRTPECVREARHLATADDTRIPIIAKIEKPQALDRLEAIVDAADGIMVARGDLGVELGPEKVPLVQKHLIDLTNTKGKVVITATQMLESMIHNPRPTRAEASDVANAVLDGTDALMLSGETAAGMHPIEAVRTMSRIITEVEQSDYYRRNLERPEIDMPVSANAIAHGATMAARSLGAKAIVAFTESGGSARLLSQYRPEATLIALTTHEPTFRRLGLCWGVIPVLVAPAVTINEVIESAEAVLRERNLVGSGDHVVITGAMPVGAGETTNMLKIHRMP